MSRQASCAACARAEAARVMEARKGETAPPSLTPAMRSASMDVCAVGVAPDLQKRVDEHNVKVTLANALGGKWFQIAPADAVVGDAILHTYKTGETKAARITHVEPGYASGRVSSTLSIGAATSGILTPQASFWRDAEGRSFELQKPATPRDAADVIDGVRWPHGHTKIRDGEYQIYLSHDTMREVYRWQVRYKFDVVREGGVVARMGELAAKTNAVAAMRAHERSQATPRPEPLRVPVDAPVSTVPRVGDVVVWRHRGAAPADMLGVDLVGRVVGLRGDKHFALSDSADDSREVWRVPRDWIMRVRAEDR